MQQKTSKIVFRGSFFRGQFSWGYISGEQISGGLFSGGLFSQGHFSGHHLIYIIIIETNFKTGNSIKIFFIRKLLISFAFLLKRTCAHLDLERKENVTHFLLLKSHLHQRYQCSFASRTNFAELQLLPVMRFFFNTVPR